MHAFHLLIVHSQPLVVAGIEALIQRVDGWNAIGTTANASSALQLSNILPPTLSSSNNNYQGSMASRYVACCINTLPISPRH
jgi:DNA-binding NarL/FixJ family response regulator